MKSLLLIVLLSGNVYADQATDSMISGFANSLQRALEARQRQEEAYQQERQVERIPNTYSTGYYDAVDNYGKLAGMQFISYIQCMRTVEYSQLYHTCVWVEKP